MIDHSSDKSSSRQHPEIECLYADEPIKVVESSKIMDEYITGTAPVDI
jgi:hypothetical protein